jgi:hypothetical protein
VYYKNEWLKISDDSTTNYGEWYPDYEGYKGVQAGKYNNTWIVSDLKIMVQSHIAMIKGTQSTSTSVTQK